MRICLVGVAHLCNNPRLVRDADALAGAGHEVRVVVPSMMEEWHEVDNQLSASRGWKLDRVDCRPRGGLNSTRSIYIRGRRRLLSELRFLHGLPSVGTRAYIAPLPELTRRALAEKADWYIAHHQGALPVAVTAAEHYSARLGFDMEDWLAESECGDPPHLVLSIERRHIPRCDYVSCTSEAMRKRIMRRYRVGCAVVLYNVPPLSPNAALKPPWERSASPRLRLHWIGQTVGPRRSLEDAIGALCLLRDRAELHFRGRLAPGYREQILSSAWHGGVAGDVHFHDRVPPEDFVRSMGMFDVGLALQLASDPNADMTTSNKIFGFMMAGLAVAATDTAGHREVLMRAPDSGLLFRGGDARSLASGLTRWAEDRAGLLCAQRAAWEAARSVYNWDQEKNKLLEVVAAAGKATGSRFAAIHGPREDSIHGTRGRLARTTSGGQT